MSVIVTLFAKLCSHDMKTFKLGLTKSKSKSKIILPPNRPTTRCNSLNIDCRNRTLTGVTGQNFANSSLISLIIYATSPTILTFS